ncbi:hypothetical protein [Streptomyces sp. NPDC001876]|uniref:hypothetical protein n=1 Tax=Streptomyces sp. NPDC001876 TaxID=3154402 RepID=UPI0033305539
MTENRPGQWPVNKPVVVGLAPAPTPRATIVPAPLAPIDVRLVLTVDLTSRYDTHREVSEHLRAQTARNVDCHTVIVRIGPDAVRHSMELGRNIAATFYLSADHIEIHAPAGNIIGALIHDEVARYVRLYRADHERETTSEASG